MTTFDIGEQLCAESFDPVGTGTFQRNVADHVEIGLGKIIAEIPHRQMSGIGTLPDAFAIEQDTSAAHQ